MNTRGRRIGRDCCCMGASLFSLFWVATDGGSELKCIFDLVLFLANYVSLYFLLFDSFGMIY